MAAASHYPQRQAATFDPSNSSITSSEGHVSVTRKAALLPYYDSTTPAAAEAAVGSSGRSRQTIPPSTPVTVVAAPPYVSTSASRSRSQSGEGSAPRKRVTFSLSPSQDREASAGVTASHSPSSHSIGSITYIPVKETRVRRENSPSVEPPYRHSDSMMNARQQQQQQQQQPLYYAPAPVVPQYLPYLVAAPPQQQQQQPPVVVMQSPPPQPQQQQTSPASVFVTPSPSLAPRESASPPAAGSSVYRDEMTYYSSAPCEPRSGFPARQHRYRLYGASPSAGIHEESPENSYSPDPRRPARGTRSNSSGPRWSGSSGRMLRSNEFLNYKGNQVGVMNRWYAEHEKPMFAFRSWMHDRYAPQQVGVKPVYFPIVSSHRNPPTQQQQQRGSSSASDRGTGVGAGSPPQQRIAVIPSY